MDLERRAALAQYVFYSLSGGRDSQAATELTYNQYRASGKRTELLFVDNGSELDGTREHAERLASLYNTTLTVLPGRSFAEIYVAKGKWPNSIHKDCVESLINKPLDAYCKEVTQGADYILVRGGRPTQRNRYSKSAEYQVVKSKPGMIIHNPLYTVPDYQNILPEWPGYEAGHSRTRCWCCPFALISDWEVMRKESPEQWEQVRRMFGCLSWRAYKGDGYLRRIKKYWEQTHGVVVPYTYPADKEVRYDA